MGQDADGTGPLFNGKRDESRGERASALDEVRRALAGQSFASVEEAKAVLDRIALRHNTRAVDDFAGLSPDQMGGMLYFPFDSPRVASFAEELPVTATAPILTLFSLLAEGIGDGLKPTATGNLPLKLVRSAALSYWGEEAYRERTRYGAIRTEPEFEELHAVRIVSEIAGLIRKYKGKLILSRNARKLLEASGPAGMYPVLFRACARQFNWGYRDCYGEIDIVQQSFLFSMYLLHRFGNEWREVAFYEDAFVRAFPQAVDMVSPSPFRTPERTIRDCYALRCLERFLLFFGLVETQSEFNGLYDRIARVRKLPLLDQVVTFPI